MQKRDVLPVLDTSFMIDLLEGKPEVRRVMAELGNRNLRTTIFCKYELLRGIGKYGADKANDLLDILETFEFTDEAMQETIKIYWRLKNEGKLIGEIDMLIAGICIANGDLLYTTDKGFDRINSPYVKVV